MSNIQTHLLAEDPSIVLIGSNTILRGQIAKMLQLQNLETVVVDSKKLLNGEQDLALFKNAYKVIWLNEYNQEDADEYLNILSILKEIKIPITIVANLSASLGEFSSDLLQEWRDKSENQTQFIIDCNYHLSKANFIFGQDVIVSGSKNTCLEFITKNIHKGLIFNIGNKLGFVESGDFVKQIKKYLFRPGKQTSVLIKGSNQDGAAITELLKKLYDSYHNVNLEIIEDFVVLENTVPFSVQEVVVETNLKNISLEVVKKLPPPKEEDRVVEINKPSLEARNAGFFQSSRPDSNVLDEGSPLPSRINSEPVVDKNGLVEKNVLVQKNALAEEDVLVQREALAKKDAMVEKTIAQDQKSENPDAKISEKTEQQLPKEVDVDVSNEIQRIFKSSRTDAKVNRIRKIATNSKIITKKSRSRKILFMGGIGITGAAIGVLVLVVVFYISQSILKKELVASISRGVINKESVLLEDEKLRKITSFVGKQVDGYGSIIENNFIADSASMVEVSENILATPQILLEADEASKNLVLQVLTGNVGETSELAQILNDKVRQAYEKLSNIQANVKLIEFNTNSDEKNKIIDDYEEKLKQIRLGMTIQQQLQPVLGLLTGEESKQTYAVILQNNQELRPTGGFIQAVALLNFEGGSLVSHDVYSVYELDKRLPGEIIPPDDIKKYLGEEKWYLRDSNWNPDFPIASKQIAWFLNKSLGIDVDGVVALNLYTFQDILEAIGPVELPEYNEVITHKNILERMEFHSEVVLVDSPSSIDYSVVVFSKIIEKVTEINRDKTLDLVAALRKSLGESQLMISTSAEETQLVLHSLGWTGSLIKPQCPTQLSVVDCKVDILAQVEANVGINKANYYLERKISHNIKVDRTRALHSREITFLNNAKSNSWPKGTYKSYQRFYLDKEAVLEKVLINGSALVDEQISKKEVNGLMEIGIKIDVPIQKQVVVELRYSTPHSFGDNFSYVFFNQRQSGTSGDPLTVTIEYSDDIKPVLIAPAAEVYGKVISFVDVVDSSLFGVSFELTDN